MNGTVYVYETDNVGRIFSTSFTYNKGAWVLHMLRGVVGEAALFDILGQYRAAFQGSAATTDDFAAIASTVAGIDLTRFFQQWVYLPGAPRYEFGWRSVAIAGAPYLQLHIRQTQSADLPIFEMPVEIRVNYTGGSISTRVANSAALQHYLIPMSSIPTGVVLDEFDWILVSGKTPANYVNGPPKVVSVSPAIDAHISAAGAPTNAIIQFSENATALPADFGLDGPAGPVGFSLAYDPPSYRATLTFDAELEPGEYRVTVHDTLRSVAALAALDGEILPAPAPFPTGDGLPGGETTWTFRVHAACPADLNHDFSVDLADLAILLANFGTTGGATTDQGDLNGDGDVGLQDLAQLLSVFGGACP